MKSLSELQSSDVVGPLQRTAMVCVAGRLVDDLDRVTDDLTNCEAEVESLRAEADRRREGGRPRRSGETSRIPELEERARALSTEADDLRAQVLEHSVAVTMEADEGRWRRFVSANPPRDDTEEHDGERRLVDRVGYGEDMRWANGLCNVKALADALHEWVVSYNGEPASEEWRTFLASAAAPGDMLKAASALAGMHVNAVDPGKSRSDWLAGRRSLNGSE